MIFKKYYHKVTKVKKNMLTFNSYTERLCCSATQINLEIKRVYFIYHFQQQL